MHNSTTGLRVAEEEMRIICRFFVDMTTIELMTTPIPLIAGHKGLTLAVRNQLKKASARTAIIDAGDLLDLVRDQKSRMVRMVIADVRSLDAKEIRLVLQAHKEAPGMRMLLVIDDLSKTTKNVSLLLRDAEVDFITRNSQANEIRVRLRLAATDGAIAPARTAGPTSTYLPKNALVPEIHNAESGKLDANEISKYLGISLAALARACGLNYKTLHRTPTARKIQDKLTPIVRIIQILLDQYGDAASVRIWLNNPHNELDARTPIALILEGKSSIVANLLDGALAGIPS
jgi:uncharacterized protein (DUF2384 family)